MTAEHLLSAYFDTNVILLIVALVWCGAKTLITRTRLRNAYVMQLHLLYGVISMVALTPLLLFLFDASHRIGIVSSRNGLTFSDFLVAQYLHGNIAMAPSKFESFLMLRTELTRDIVTMGSWIGSLVVVGLLSGFLYIVVKNALTTIKLVRIIKESYVLRRIGRVDVRFTHETTVPFSTRGLFRHYVVLPTGLLAHNNDVRIAVSHEMQHIRQRDLTWEIGLELLRPFFFWNPAFAYCKRDVERIRELACDQQVLCRRTHLIRAYCECLLRVCKNSLTRDHSNQIMTPSVPFVQLDQRASASHSESFLMQRIVSVLDGPSTVGHSLASKTVMLALVMIVMGATVALRPVNDWSHDRLMLSTIVNLERLNTRTIQP
ncbi:Signal transducer regulating beta-lactamase production, contains metallopeptidase domain [Cognatiyoonia koreensis]|uniref:Signal transducer regulating beta-lactamase production, contains metallopeptidase domain n=1 Tax=Cognatiyoonia koreensis TaxID=364200 RepID=A0A1I0RTP1_9RHOB|nr:M56 family metallopeptidase [Cognatiyoonia koreensis]SEW44574.1 Signal transducer regulating beta-lactamase production, contains metallopeptidase domain [Cognatiyoonia koreensis]